jgi:hypothetical protein
VVVDNGKNDSERVMESNNVVLKVVHYNYVAVTPAADKLSSSHGSCVFRFVVVFQCYRSLQYPAVDAERRQTSPVSRHCCFAMVTDSADFCICFLISACSECFCCGENVGKKWRSFLCWKGLRGSDAW